MNAENDEFEWRVEEEGEGEVDDSSHDAEVGWQLSQRGVRTVGSDPKGKPPDRVATGVGGHRGSLSLL